MKANTTPDQFQLIPEEMMPFNLAGETLPAEQIPPQDDMLESLNQLLQQINQTQFDTMNLEIYFRKEGNTIVGSYSNWQKIETIIRNKGIVLPDGHILKIEPQRLQGFLDRLDLFGYCITTITGWQNLCIISDVKLLKA
jgi:hypothetical protein